MSISSSTANGTTTIPPPPPPQPMQNQKILERINNSSSGGGNRRILPDCIWAFDYPELQQSCYLSQICTTWPPKVCRYHNIKSILQDGPTCGLTAISILLNNNPTPEEILDIAKKHVFTRNGEMFSAKNLNKLLLEILKQKQEYYQIDCQLYQGRLNCNKVKEALKNNACILVPYPFNKK